jgi:glyoxylase-like metal-dependent hydrolase (beta-lactamase superfamily II)
MPDSSAVPHSEHFELHELAQGVYAAIASDGGGAFSNAGIIDLGDRTLIFDTFNTPQAAQDLRAAAEALTGRPASVVIISHIHSDHWMGNQVFAGHALLLTTRAICDAMPEWAEGLREWLADPSHYEAEIQQTRERLERETDPRWRASLELFLARAQHVRGAMPILDLTLPDVAFDGALSFHGPQRAAELRIAAPGHTDSDAYLLLPGDGIAFLGDLGFFASQPFMVYCDPQAWAAHLQAFEASDLETFVPGHGPVGTKTDLALQRQYLEALEGMVARVIAAGGSADDAIQAGLPAPFARWLHGGMARFEANVRSAYERLSERS